MIRKSIKIILAYLLLPVLALQGCSTKPVSTYAGQKPEIDLFSYFTGSSYGQGVFFDRFGSVASRFTVQLNGQVEGNRLSLAEELTYSTGEKLARTYTITMTSPGKYKLECPDLVEPGVIETAGNAARWNYTLKQDVGEGTIRNLRFDDWMLLQERDLILNRARASWYGIDVGEVVMIIQKERS